MTNEVLTNLKPIFIHSLPRTSSTYLFSKFREKKSYYCYYEPFNHLLSELNNEILEGNISELTRYNSHPGLNKHYFFEYQWRQPAGVPFFKKRFIVDDFCLDEKQKDEGLKRYIQFLISNATQQPVFKFATSSLRSGWLKNNFDSINIYLSRDHRNHYSSYLKYKSMNNPFYFVFDLMIVGKNSRSCKIAPLSDILHVPLYKDESFYREYDFYHAISNLYTGEEHYFIFFYLWLISFMENMEVCDIVINVDAVSAEKSRKGELSNSLKRYGINIDLSDCNIKSYETSPLPSSVMYDIESEVIDMIYNANIFDSSTINRTSDFFARGDIGFMNDSANRYQDLNNIQNLMKLGEFCFNHALMSEAKFFFEKALHLDPDNSDALNNLGVLCFALGDKKSARTLFSRVLELNALHLEAVENFKILND